MVMADIARTGVGRPRMPEDVRFVPRIHGDGWAHAGGEGLRKTSCAKAINASKRQTTGFCCMVGVQGYLNSLAASIKV